MVHQNVPETWFFFSGDQEQSTSHQLKYTSKPPPSSETAHAAARWAAEERSAREDALAPARERPRGTSSEGARHRETYIGSTVFPKS